MKATQTLDEYRASIGHYTGKAGARYFAYQSQFGEIVGELTARKFAPYIKPSDIVLDFGCGGGFVLARLNCQERIGVEINPLARDTARTKGIRCYEVLDQIEDETIDVVISHHSLEHVSSPLAVLKELRIKLKPGGLLLLVVPIDDWRTQMDYDPSDINHHLYTWTPLLLGNLLYEAGFDASTHSTTIGINGWIRNFQWWYRRVPYKLFNLLSHVWCKLRRTREIYAVVRRAQHLTR